MGNYRVSKEQLTGKGPYKAKIELLGQMVPINLISTIQIVGFDYNMSPRAIGDAVVAGREVTAEETVTFDTDKQGVVMNK